MSVCSDPLIATAGTNQVVTDPERQKMVIKRPILR